MRVLITGAAAGLAQGIALVLARAGEEVTFTYRPGGTPPDATLALLRKEGFDARPAPVEFLGDEAAVREALRNAVQSRADALVHAVGPMTIARFERSTPAVYREMVDGNLRSAVLAAEAVLPGMRERGFGRLVFFGMNGAEVTRPARGLALHLAAKAGVVAFAKTLALEEARYGITSNVIEPGDIRRKALTRAEARGERAANPRGRPGTYEDVADAVRFLIDRDHDFVNGAVVAVGGGLIEPYERNDRP